eukprot:UN04883
MYVLFRVFLYNFLCHIASRHITCNILGGFFMLRGFTLGSLFIHFC